MEATVPTFVASVSRLVILTGGAGAGLPPEAIRPVGLIAAGAAPAVLGITDLLDGDDEDEGDDDDDAVFEDGDDLGGLGDLDEEGLDGFDEAEDGLGGADGDVSELENRLDELENEVASLSSSVNTVQTENEAVGETVDEIQENVRDLLEIYEMVTRGVNPFVDDATTGALGDGGGGNFGLFDDDGDEAGDVDESISETDAEEFFDDDFDGPDDDFADPDDAAVLGDDLEDGMGGPDDSNDFGDGMGGPDHDDADEGDGESGDEGKSFEELKAEYESGEAGWDVDDPLGADDGEAVTDDSEEVADDGEAVTDDGDPLDAGSDGTAESDGEEADGLVFDDGAGAAGGPDAADREELDDVERTDPDGHDGRDDGTPPADREEFEFVGEREDDPGDDRPHLREFPEGYAADLAALEWLEYLVGVGGTDGARDALAYYADIGWIAPSVKADLHAFLDGFQAPAGERAEPGGHAGFEPEHHRRSLAYVARLAGDGDRTAVLDRLDASTPAAPVGGAATPTDAVADGGDPEREPTGGDGDGV